MYSTKLSTLLNRMDRYQPISTIEEQYKVRDLDEAIRGLNQTVKIPWSLKKTTLRVFNNVLEYPVADDHDELAFLDTPKQNIYETKPNFYYTSIQEFYENDNDRNDLCEIWKNGTKYLGVRLDVTNVGSQKCDTSKIVANYTASGDASNIVADTVIYKEDEGNNSIGFTNTVSSGTATVSASFVAISDSNYKQKYFFVWMFLSGTPTSITLKLGNDTSNYLYKSVTAQFSGEAFSANDWNLLAFDLNTASTVGTINSNQLDFFQINLVGAAAGYYNIDNAYLRQWDLLDYWYYSNYSIKTNSSSVPDQAYFYNDTTEQYSTDSSLVGDKEWADVVMYDAIVIGLADEKDGSLYPVIKAKRDDAWSRFLAKYPDMVPLITTTKYKFETDYFINTPWRG